MKGLRCIVAPFAIFCVFVFSAQASIKSSVLNCAIALGVSFGSASVAQAQDTAAVQSTTQAVEEKIDREITSEQRLAINRGLEFLARSMNPNGYWNRRETNFRSDSITAGQTYRTAQTALAGLAFLSAGSTARSGPYRDQVLAVVRFLVTIEEQSTEGGLGNGVYSLNDPRPMFGQGYAMVFLAQNFGMIQDRALQARVHASLTRATEAVVALQTKDGGWGYPENNPEGTVTVVGIQALRAVKDAGLSVPIASIDRAKEYLRISQMENGGIRYRYNDSSTAMYDGGIGLAAATLCVFHSIGNAERNPVYTRTLAYLHQRITTLPNFREVFMGGGRLANHTGEYSFFYNLHYLTQAFYQIGGRDWDWFYPQMRDLLVREQQRTGAWNSEYGEIVGTAFAVISLSVPTELAPAYQR